MRCFVSRICCLFIFFSLLSAIVIASPFDEERQIRLPEPVRENVEQFERVVDNTSTRVSTRIKKNWENFDLTPEQN